ncbi:hypothetical protein AtNW77_Chr5g0115541 [Arabidopsis thaliana]
MGRRITKISSDLHTLGIAEFVDISGCMIPVFDLAGFGVEVFCSLRRISRIS